MLLNNDGRRTQIIYLLHPQNPLFDARISEISHTLCGVIPHFVPNFVAMAMGVSQGKMRLAAFSGSSPNPPPSHRRKNLANILHTDHVIANFVQNFVAIAMGLVRGMAAFSGLSPKTPCRRKNFADIFYTSRVVAHFVPNFVAMTTRKDLG